jgi:hypothetical protein
MNETATPEGTLDVEAVIAALNQATTPLERGLALMRPSERRLVRRCALARRFDQALAAGVLAPLAGATELDFERLVGLPGVGAAAGRPGWYRLDPGERAAHEGAWLAGGSDEDPLGPERFREAQARLADWFQTLGPDGQLEALYHRLAADPQRGAQEFHALYDEATRGFDLARCESLLEVLDQRARFLAPELASFRTEARGLLRARSAVADDYFRSARYLERRGLRRAFESLLEDRWRFILHLHGSGGRGKTMFLRWLAARFCLERGIPVARVDFDFLDSTEVGLAPRFFFGKLAERLNLQLSNAPFVELLDVIRQMRRAATSRRAAAGESAADVAIAEEEEILARFATILEEHCRGTVLLVFDTLEDARLKHQVDVLGIVRAVEAVRGLMDTRARALGRVPPRVVLILSGRYPLEEQYPEVARSHGEWVQSVPVTPFDDSEARLYLTENRQLRAVDEGVLAQVIRRAGGSPFNLALFADVLQTSPTITKEDLENNTSIELLYLIERVLKRIPDYRVRWVLRYGVVARRLTREFLEEVLGPHLARAMRGDRTYDDPAIDVVEDEKDWPELWQTQERASRLGKPAFDDIWTRLRDFASASSWVTVAPEAGDALVIQPVVTHPMRRALRSQKVVARIHRDAVAALQRRVKKRRATTEDLAALTYHDFQLRGARAARDWEKLLGESLSDPETLEAVAGVVLSEDLRESEAGRGALVTAPVEARAHFALAQAAHGAAGAETGEKAESLRERARAALRAYEACVTKLGRPVALPVEEATLRWELAANPQEKEAALGLLAKAEPRARGDERVALLNTLQQAWAGRDPARAEGYARKLAELAQKQGDVDAFGEAVRSLVESQTERGAYAEAIDSCAAARASLAPAEKRWDAAGAVAAERKQLDLLQARIEGDCGLPERALARQPLNRSGSGEADPDQVLLRAHLLLGSGEAEEALRTLRAVRWEKPRRSKAIREAGWSRMQSLGLRGRAQRMVMSFAEALDLFQGAMVLAGELGAANDELAHRLAKARLHLFDIGDLQQAAEHLRVGSGEPAAFNPELLIVRRLLVASLTDLQGDSARAAFTMTKLAGEPWTAFTPQRGIAAAVTALTLRDPPEPIEWLTRLRDQLARVDHPLARVAQMQALPYCSTVDQVPGPLADALTALVTPAARDSLLRDLPDGDVARFRLGRLELLRVLGRRDQAVDELRALRPLLRGRRWPRLFNRHVALTCDRLRLPSDEVLPRGWLDSFRARFAERPTLVAVALLEAAERAFVAGDPRVAADLAMDSRKCFRRAEGPRSRHERRLMALLARLAHAQGSLAVARDYEGRAARIDEELGWPREARPLSREAPAVVESVEGVATRKSGLETVVLRAEAPDRFQLSTLDGGGEHTAEPDHSPDGPITQMLVDLEVGPLGGRASLALVERLTRPGPHLGLALAEAFLPGPLRERVHQRLRPGATEEPLDVAIECGSAHQLHAFPWELLAVDPRAPLPLGTQPGVGHVWRSRSDTVSRARVSWAQRALAVVLGWQMFADGIAGPNTRRALAAFQEQQRLPVTGNLDRPTRLVLRDQRRRLLGGPAPSRRVLLLESAEQDEVRSARGYRSVGIDLTALYASEGFDAHALREPDLNAIREVLQRQGCGILHVSAPIAESRSSGELFLQLGSASTLERAATVLGPSSLGAVLKAASVGRPAPLVIVDVPRPPTLSEAARQLVLRNVFAAKLSTAGAVPAVLAAGLAPPKIRHRVSSGLVAMLASRPPPGQLVRYLRKTENAAIGAWDPELLLGTACVALFTDDPELDPTDWFFPEAEAD